MVSSAYALNYADHSRLEGGISRYGDMLNKSVDPTFLSAILATM
jgi:hypothetical protein